MRVPPARLLLQGLGSFLFRSGSSSMAPGLWSLNVFTGFGIWADGNGWGHLVWKKQSSPTTVQCALLKCSPSPSGGASRGFLNLSLLLALQLWD